MEAQKAVSQLPYLAMKTPMVRMQWEEKAEVGVGDCSDSENNTNNYNNNHQHLRRSL